MNNKISPGQCHGIGGLVSDRLFASDASFEKAQQITELVDHPFWNAFEDLVKNFLIEVEETTEKAKEKVLDFVCNFTLPA